MASKAAPRYRNFATVFYPESCDFEFMRSFVSDLHVPAFISPLHDKDFNPDGEHKKDHWHVLLMFDGKKSTDQIRELLDGSGAVGVEVVQSQRGYARYLCHLDNPEKYKYNLDDITELSGACYDDVIGLPINDIKACQDMQDWIVDNHIYYIDQLLDYAHFNRPDWYRVLCNSKLYFMKEYIYSRKRRVDQEYYERSIRNQETPGNRPD